MSRTGHYGSKSASEILLILNSGLDGDTIGVIEACCGQFRRPRITKRRLIAVER
jgi:hypothetical protein